MKTKNLILALSIILISTGCASIVHGPLQPISIVSQPTGAQITIDGKGYGITPQTVMLRRMGRLKGEPSEKQYYNLSIELEGYMPYELKLKREMDGWFVGNILLGGLIGIIIDAANGSMYKLSPDQVVSTLAMQTAINNKNDDGVFIAVALNVDPSWEKIGELKRK